jgi:uncharacterized protein
MHETDFIAIIAQQLGIQARQVAATIKLLNEGSTVPFISRYRKELTQALDEVHIENIRLLNLKYTELVKRKLTIIDTIKEQGKLTPALEKSIVDCWDTNLLEDIYLPYKPKRKTKASVAIEKGLEPLAMWLLKETNFDVENEAKRYLKNDVSSTEDALQGARDIIADVVNEDIHARTLLRNQFQKFAGKSFSTSRSVFNFNKFC